MLKLRFRFEKTGQAIYISHLDLMRTFRRAFARADTPIRFSEGFNPHPKISVVAPLSLGNSSVCELLDAEFIVDSLPEDTIEKLNSFMPAGIKILSIAEPVRKTGELAWIGHELRLVYDEPRKGNREKLAELFLRSELIVTKRTKRGEAEANISPMIKDFSVCEDGPEIVISAKLAFGESVLGPAYLCAAIEKYMPEETPDFAKYLRTETYTKDFQIFR